MNLSPIVKEYIQRRHDDKLEKLDKAEIKAVSVAQKAGEQTDQLIQSFAEKKTFLLEEHKPEAWLTDAARRAAQISLVTHAAKFSHSDSRASSFTAQIANPDINLLGTHSCLLYTSDAADE